MNAPSVDRRDAASPRRRFPIVDALEALDAWRREPNPDRRRWLSDVLTAVVTAAGADGAYLEVDAAPLPELSIGIGILTERPDEASITDRGEGPSIGRFELHAALGDRRLGTLWLAAGDPDGSVAVRVLELAIDAAWSRAEVVETTHRLEALDVATRAIAAILDIDRTLQLIVDTVRDLVGAEYAALGIVDEYGSIERFITTGLSDEERTRIGPPPRGRGLLGLIIREDRSYRIPDIGSHPDSSGFPRNHPPMASFLGVPVHVKGVSVGNLYLTNKRGASSFGKEDQGLVEMFAVHAGIAIENARLHERVQRLAIVEERERIGKDLHDGIIQSLYAVGLSLEDVPELMSDEKAEAAARVDRAIDAINLAIRDIRNFIFGLRPESLESADLVSGLATLADEFRVNTMIDLEVDLPQERLDLPADARLQLLQLAREALSNVSRHSGATRSRLGLTLDLDGTRLTITDNGRGFDPGRARADGHLGLRNMEARAYAVGGTFEIDSGPNLGTRIIVRVPDAAAAVAGGPRSTSED